jgi:hypothetical protein
MTEGNGNVVAHRLTALERDVASIERVAEEAAQKVTLHEEQINGKRGLSQALEALNGKVDSLIRVGWAIATSVVGGAVLLVLQSSGKLL